MSAYTRPRRDPLERFMEKVQKSDDGCWLWIGATWDTRTGYGAFCPGGRVRPVRAHRWAYSHFIGPIPSGMQVDHRCHVKSCVNPEHLRPATNKQNVENVPGLRSDNQSGYRGVSPTKCGRKWRARVRHNGTLLHLGTFDTAEEAGAVALAKRLELFTHNDSDRTS